MQDFVVAFYYSILSTWFTKNKNKKTPLEQLKHIIPGLKHVTLQNEVWTTVIVIIIYARYRTWVKCNVVTETKQMIKEYIIFTAMSLIFIIH